jgi:hypothetical protein
LVFYRRVRCVVVDRLLTRMKLVDRTELLIFVSVCYSSPSRTLLATFSCLIDARR